jgi:DsbC/DsbD-like thiol-disulfide interchange protein/cytochrome c biogenesis protein CcdA
MKRISKTVFLVAIFFSFAIGIPSNSFSQVVYSANTEVEMIPQFDGVNSGSSMFIALRMDSDEHWHTYWVNPGDAGYSTHIDWDLPEGMQASSVIWPVPTRLELPPVMTYGYEGEVFLLSEIQIPESLDYGSYVIKSKVQWLACKIACVPGIAEFSIPINVSKIPQKNFVFSKRFPKALEMLPQKNIIKKATFIDGIESFQVVLNSAGLGKNIKDVYFFPYDSELITHSSKQNPKILKNKVELSLKKSPLYKKEFLASIEGLVLVESNDVSVAKKYYEISIRNSALIKSVGGQVDVGIWVALFSAFIGGLILNLMPCVLPVLSLKIMSLIEHAHQKNTKLVYHGFLFASGVIVSFWSLAAVLMILKFFGKYVGWGFQFQSPIFIVFMATLFFALALNLFGVFEIGVAFTRLEGVLPEKKSYKSSFFNGILATIVATPCTAPFMGSALGYALVKPPMYSFLIFTFLGLGMAFPYLLLTIFPSFLKFLPKPGKWMITLKKFFGVLFLVTVLWLLWVLHVQKGFGGVSYLLVSICFTGIGIWILGKWAGFNKSKKVNFYSKSLCLVFLISGLVISNLGILGLPNRSLEESSTVSSEGILWKKFNQQEVDSAVKEGSNVFINFTASWCLSCNVNEKVAFNSREVIKKFKEY